MLSSTERNKKLSRNFTLLNVHLSVIAVSLFNFATLEIFNSEQLCRTPSYISNKISLFVTLRIHKRLILLNVICHGSATPPPPPPFFLFKDGKQVLITSLRVGGKSERLKRRWKYDAGADLFERGWSQHFSYLTFPRFIIFTFRNYFSLCEIELCI